MKSFRNIKAGHLKYAFLLGGIFLVLRLATEMYASRQYVDNYRYGRVDVWRWSSVCTANRNLILAICDLPGILSLGPIENVNHADDPGHALIGNLITLFTRRPMTYASFVRINLAINALGVLLLSRASYLIGFPYTALFILVFGAFWGVPGIMPGADVTAAYFGLFCTGLAGMVLLIDSFKETVFINQKFRSRVFKVLAIFSFVNLLREGIGTCVIYSTLALIFFEVFKKIPRFHPKDLWRKKLFWLERAALVLLLIFIPLNISNIVIGFRNLIHPQLGPSIRVISHGMSHNLLIGLGYYEGNVWKYGYADTEGYRLAMLEDPKMKTAYATPEYFKLTGKLYLRMLKQHPYEALKTYLRKAEDVFSLVMFKVPLYYFGFLSLFAVILAPLLRPASKVKYFSFLRTLVAFTGLIVLQGVLVAPQLQFVYPSQLGILLVFIAWVECGVASVRLKNT